MSADAIQCEACGDIAVATIEMYSGWSRTRSAIAEVCAKCEARAKKKPLNVWSDVSRRRDMMTNTRASLDKDPAP